MKISRRELHDALLAEIRRLPHVRPVLVAIDGPDAAGKTVLADELAALLSPSRPVIRASIDGFHRPSQERRRRGPLSPEGYYEDSFDYHALRARLLTPLRDGDRRIVPAVFDLDADVPMRDGERVAPADAILIFEGVFLQRVDLRGYWDLAIYLHVDEKETLRRARVRDLPRMGSVAEIDRRYRARYLPAQAIYRAAADPLNMADIVIDNTDVAVPKIVRWRRPLARPTS